MTGVPINNWKNLKVGDTLIETREEYKGLKGRIISKSFDGLEFEVIKVPDKSEHFFEIGEEFFFEGVSINRFFLREVEKNNIKKL